VVKAGLLTELMLPVITDLYGCEVSKKKVQIKFVTYWSVIHGLIAINVIKRDAGTLINQQILFEAINGITSSIINQG
jgi:hypothetical protein